MTYMLSYQQFFTYNASDTSTVYSKWADKTSPRWTIKASTIFKNLCIIVQNLCSRILEGMVWSNDGRQTIQTEISWFVTWQYWCLLQISNYLICGHLRDLFWVLMITRSLGHDLYLGLIWWSVWVLMTWMVKV